MSRLASSVLLSLFAVAACGGEDEHILPGTDAPADASPDAPIDAPAPPMPTALYVGGDFAVTGILSSVDVAARTVQPNVIAGVAGGEPWVRRFGNEVFIVNRAGGNNITILGGSPLVLVDQFATGADSNPQDVAVVGNKLYVPAYETTGVVVIDRTTRATTTIDLSAANAADDPDDQPDCSSVFAVGTRVFVACQRQDRSGNPWVPRGAGRVVVIDTTDDSVVTGFDLGTPQTPLINPVGLFEGTPATSFFAGYLLLPVVPSFSDVSTGCLARVSTGSSPGFNGCAATNQAMDGYVNRVSISPDNGRAWLAVFRYQFVPSFGEFGHLRTIDLTTGALGDPITATATSTILDVAACPGGYAVATDSAGEPAGLRVYLDGTERTTAPLDLGRVPNSSNGLTCF
jgi:hypothetical protein